MGGYSTECAWGDITRRRLRASHIDPEWIYQAGDGRWMRDAGGSVDCPAVRIGCRTSGTPGIAVSKCPRCGEVPVRVSREVDRRERSKWSLALDAMRCACGHEYVSRSRVLTAQVTA